MKKQTAETTGYISDDYDEQQQQFIWHAQNARSGTLASLNTFLSSDNGSMVNPSGSPTTNIYEKKGKCYNIPPHRINEFFRRLALCCSAKDFVLFTERQLEPSGLMIDLDIYQESETSRLNTSNVHLLCTRLVEYLTRFVAIGESQTTWHVAITKKPTVKYDNDKRCFKDGLHCLIPSVKLSRAAKRVFIERLISDKIVSRALKDVPIDPVQLKASVAGGSDGYVDVNSSHVPVFFYGCSTKHDDNQRISKPYELFALYEALIVSDQQDSQPNSAVNTPATVTTAITLSTPHVAPRAPRFTVILSDCKARFLGTDIRDGGPIISANLQHELSINFEAPNGIIKKRDYVVAPEYLERVMAISKSITLGTTRLEQLDRNLRAVDSELRSMLDILDIGRADRYDQWLEIMRALSTQPTKNKDLAEYFSRKSRKFNKVDFERTWASLVLGTANDARRTTVGTIYFRARQDNPDRYAEIKKNSTAAIITERIHHRCNGGDLGHYDFAEILFKHVGHRFRTDYPIGGRDQVWYEFIDRAENALDGELYKWFKHPKQPNSLMMHVCNELKRAVEEAYDHIAQCATNAQDENQAYLKRINDKLRMSIRKLSDAPFIKNILVMAMSRFSQRGFAERLDKDPLIRGVKNGVLRLNIADGGRPELITGYHDYAVSRYFRVPYVPFDPRDPETKRLLVLLRNLFPEDETDSFEFTMYYLASTIDGQSKESMFMILYGPGKNGKSKLIELHRAALGDYCVKLPLSFLTSPNPPSASATPDMAKLRDATITTFSESKQGECLQTERIKEVTGGETLAARPLYSEIINFKPRSHFLVATNFEFTIEGDDYGTWRRMLFNPFKIKFVSPNDNDIRARLVKRKAEASAAGLPTPTIADIMEKNERWADDSMKDEWIEKPEIAGRYLGILVWFHYWLYHTPAFKKSLANVPHPHIKYETDRYHARQSPIKEFLRLRLVKRADITIPMPLSDMVRIYQDWYTRHWRQTAPSSRVVVDQLKNSCIGAAIRSTDRGDQLVGYRCLGEGDEKEADETMGMPGETFTIPPDNFGVPSETTEEFYERICAEFDRYAEIFSSGRDDQDVAMDATAVDFTTIDTGAGQTQGGQGLQTSATKRPAHSSAIIEIPNTDIPTMQVCGNPMFDEHARTDNLPGVAHKAWEDERVERYNQATAIVGQRGIILSNGRTLRRGAMADRNVKTVCDELCDMIKEPAEDEESIDNEEIDDNDNGDDAELVDESIEENGATGLPAR